jgi:hypothetical protein
MFSCRVRRYDNRQASEFAERREPEAEVEQQHSRSLRLQRTCTGRRLFANDEVVNVSIFSDVVASIELSEIVLSVNERIRRRRWYGRASWRIEIASFLPEQGFVSFVKNRKRNRFDSHEFGRTFYHPIRSKRQQSKRTCLGFDTIGEWLV